MKKILCLGACVASLAIASSVAFADYTYTAEGDFELTNPTTSTTGNVTQISIDSETAFQTSGQLTVLILSGTKDEAIITDQEKGTSYFDTSKIMYIDQETAGENNFQSMGLRLGENVTTLPKGTYTICVGGDSMTEIKETTLTVAEKSTGKTVYIGDVDGTNTADSIDAAYILSYDAKGAADRGGVYPIGTKVKTSTGVEFVIGDVDGTNSVDSIDAAYILSYDAKGVADRGGAYPIGTKVDNTTKVTETAN